VGRNVLSVVAAVGYVNRLLVTGVWCGMTGAKEGEIGRTCSTHGRDEKCIQNLGLKA